VLICGVDGHPLDRVGGAAWLRRGAASLMRGFSRGGLLSRTALRAGRLALARELAYLSGGAHRELCPREVLDGVFAHTAAMDPVVAGRVVASYFEHSAREVLPRIEVPTLILAGDRDQLTPVSSAERMQRAIRGSRLVVYPGHSHLLQVERPDDVHAEIGRFLAESA
jgi:pimeloyl-ACP methyl ester carboxylesterase